MNKQHIRTKKSQKATAIITAILIVSVISIAAITMQGYLYGELNRTQMVIDGDNLLNSLYDVESWGLSRVKHLDNKKKDGDDINNSTENAPQPDNKITIQSYNSFKTAEIINQNRFFNINYLYNLFKCAKKSSDINQQIVEEMFVNLVTKNVQDITREEVSTVVSNIQKWMCNKNSYDPEELANISGELIDNAWRYQASGQIIFDISELKLIPGVTDKIYKAIVNKITAFPIELKNNNVQMSFVSDEITPDLLVTLASVNLEEATSFLATINDLTGKDKTNKIKQYITGRGIYNEKQLAEIDKLITDKQQDSYYKILSKSKIGKYEMQMVTLIHVGTNKKVNVLWRKRGLANG